MLPALREDLVVYPGPANGAGEPSWTVHDPARNRFFRIDWLTYEIIGRWSYRDPVLIAQTVSAQTPLSVAEDDVESVARFMLDSELVQADFPAASAFFAERRRQRRKSWGEWLLHNYLFIRVPLIRPDVWLARHVGKAEAFGTALFLRLTLIALAFGLWQVVRQWELFRTAFVDAMNPAGLLAYAITVIAVKIAHEFGHGFVAKHYGCRVPTMGVAFLVLWPVAYTDTTDTWKLDDKRKRLRVACAGVATELAIAAWATALWALLPDGALRTAAFLLATTTWVSAVVVNFNPLMRFDGYYILSDWLDIPNLHDRAFALARWHLRRTLLGVDEPPPEAFPPRTRRTLIALAWVTWLYRLALYIGIALLVYHFFVKAVGILLFIVEMWWFIMRPIARELKLWWERRAGWQTNSRARRTALIGGGALALLFLPLPLPVTATALLSPARTHHVYAPEAGRIAELKVPVGRRVAAGQMLAVIGSPSVASEADLAQARVDGLRQQIAAAAVDVTQRDRLLALQADLQAAEADLASRSQRSDRLELRMPFAGRIVDGDPDLQVGEWVAKGTPIATIANDRRWQAFAYVDARQVDRLAVGDRASFFGRDGSRVPLKIVDIDHDTSRALPSGLYAATTGGDIAAFPQDGGLVPEGAVVRVRLLADEVPSALAGHSWRGQVVIDGAWTSLGWRYARSAIALLVREAGF